MTRTKLPDQRKLEKTKTPGVYRRGSSYMVVYSAHGKQRKRSARTYDEARALKATLAADVHRGEYRERANTTLRDYAREWLGSTTGLRQSTRDGYRWSLEQKAVPYFTGRAPRLADIEPRDVRAYVAWLLDAKEQGRALSANTVRNHLAALRVLLGAAVEDGLLRYNPAAQVRIALPQKERKARAMTAEQLGAVLAALDDEWRLFFGLLAATGCRIGEALELRWGDVDFGGKRLHVQRQIYHGNIARPKSAAGVRHIPLSTSLAQQLWRLQGAPDAPLFTGPRGLHVDRRWLARQVLAPAAKRAGVPWVTFHTFRHTCASLLFAAGKNAKQVQAWMGHADAAFTLRTYVHLMDDGLGGAECMDVWGNDGAIQATGTQANGQEAATPEKQALAGASVEPVQAQAGAGLAL